jgi:hypothetical protein
MNFDCRLKVGKGKVVNAGAICFGLDPELLTYNAKSLLKYYVECVFDKKAISVPPHIVNNVFYDKRSLILRVDLSEIDKFEHAWLAEQIKAYKRLQAKIVFFFCTKKVLKSRQTE